MADPRDKLGFHLGEESMRSSTVRDILLFCSCINVYVKYLYKMTKNYMDKWLEDPSFTVFTSVYVVRQVVGIGDSVIAGHLQVLYAVYLI